MLKYGLPEDAPLMIFGLLAGTHGPDDDNPAVRASFLSCLTRDSRVFCLNGATIHPSVTFCMARYAGLRGRAKADILSTFGRP